MSADDIFVAHGKAGTPLKDVFVMDCHCHLGPTRRLRALDSSVDSLMRVMDLLGVDIAAPSSLPASPATSTTGPTFHESTAARSCATSLSTPTRCPPGSR